MDILETLTVSGIVSILITFIGGLFVKQYLPIYMEEKGRNLTTKEDIADIIRETEEVRSEFLSKLELEKKRLILKLKKLN